MKLILFTFILSCSFLSLKAQSWVDLGIKGGFGADFLLNSNVFNDNDYNHEFSTGYSFGGKIGFNFNQEHEITFDAIGGVFQQKFSHTSMDTLVSNSIKSETGFNFLELILMYRRNKNGSYLEFGPCISFIKSPYFKDGEPLFTPVEQSDFNTMNKGLVLGFGSYLLGTENFGITTGIRITKYFDDLLSSQGKNKGLFTYKNYSSYKPYTPLFIEFVVEANLDFAYMAKANCGRKKILFF